MTYLVRSFFGLKEVEKYEKVIRLLRTSTTHWCNDELYIGEEDPETLFQECLKNKDFGDIAQVYEVDTYFKVGRGKVPCGLYIADKDTDFRLRRIF